ncbi:MAG: hypothetical protein LUQ25_05340 [Methanoregulaceae archaeon]|nr:hypothetical protein [Methanoregulaceae archaeon]
MDTKSAVRWYQFGERAKSELIICSQLTIAVAGFKEGAERAGGKKTLLLLLDAVRAEIEFGFRDTGSMSFRRSADLVSEAISLVESDGYEPAGLKISGAVSEATTAAQTGWQVLSEHGLL